MKTRLQIKMVIIANDHGVPLVSVKIDDSLNEELITPYFSVIHKFADSGTMSTEETKIKMDNNTIIINRKDGLMLIGIFDGSLTTLPTIKETMYNMLELFHDIFKEELADMEENIAVDMTIFKRFETLIEKQIDTYLHEVKKYDSKGIFSKIIEIIKERKKQIMQQ